MFARVFKRIADDPFRPPAGEYGLLDHRFVRRIRFLNLAPATVFPFGIFPDDDKINLLVFDRGTQSRQQLHGAEVHILVKPHPYRQEKFTQ